MKIIQPLLVLILSVLSAAAATKTWDGSNSGLWSVNANWAGGVKPVNGDDLVFPAGAAHLVTTNDFSGLHLHSITFSTGNYSLLGDSLTVSNGILNSSAGLDGIQLTVTVASSQAFTCANGSGQGRRRDGFNLVNYPSLRHRI